MTDQRTVQLRRYRIADGEFDAFVQWWRTRLVAAREAHGFAVDFAYALRASNEFVWAVSVEGDAEAFAAVERRYLDSPERAAAFDGVPQRTTEQVVALVDRIR